MSPRRPVSLPGADKEAVRRHLVDAAAVVLRRRHTAAVTVREIAQEAGVAAGLLYNHFADKDDLLAMALLERGPAFASGGDGPLSKPGSATVVDNLFEYAMATIVVLREVLPVVLTATPALMGRIADAFHSGSNPHIASRAKVGEYLRAEQDLGRVRADADVDIASLLISGALHEIALFAGLGAPPEDDETVVRRIVDSVAAVITHGGPADPG